ncbi:hypothetical protein BJY16_009192 [Actinoplanes octamycinicus]|uniref:VWFA domain-containing protein n=1 Tax=Actinoplanes octamycinicus TaxID=135948 RepID=A0A7W7H8C5_9ACTN|nr:hypothetical protein [Actinoplanes octamycinicus]MBB4745733.1 hypothetical protein [Actinoplanes octamycinicus]GIE56581.1 hypothetical protein Aoc01nite_19830 [Actinoplanes octamycinicus]
MGSGRWSTDVYAAAEHYRAATGQSAFAYSDSGARRVHAALDPRDVFMRECRDSDEHPASTPIVVMFDVTGSMRHVPRVLQAELPQLLGRLTQQGRVTDPQIMFGAIGDATCDRVPLQVGQFESDNRMDEDLSRIVLEGGGGGGKRESYELAMYFLARHVVTDSMVQRQKKGFLFLIGDEMPYQQVKPDEVGAVIGDDLRQPIPTREILAELRRKFEVFFILPTAASHGGDRQVLRTWRDLLGQNVLELDDLADICETIARQVASSDDEPRRPQLSLTARRW